MWDPYAEFESATLPNGLTVHAAHWSGRPWQAMGFLVHSGAEQDPVGLEGLAHFTEHLVASGSMEVPAQSVVSFFKDHGGDAGLGSTGYEGTRYSFFVPLDHAVLAKAFELYGNMLLNARFGAFVERERSVILSEYARRFRFQFDYDRALRKRKALYAGHFLERFCSPLGNPDSISRITQDNLQSFYDTAYTPRNISVVAVGGMNLAEVVDYLTRSPFGARKEGARTPLPLQQEYLASPSENRFVFEVSKYATVPYTDGGYESEVGLPGIINEQVLSVLRAMLNEVLNEEVREKRMWTYNIGSGYIYSRSFWQFSIGCASFKIQAMDSIEGVIEDCIKSLHDRTDLFERKRSQLIADSNMIDQNGRQIRDISLMELADWNRIGALSEVRNDLERVTMDDVRAVLEMLRPERRWTCITRP